MSGRGSNTAPKEVFVIGRGRFGRALLRALHAAGMETGSWTRASAHPMPDPDAGVVVLAVSDAAVAEVAHALPPRPGRVVLHCAGALGLDVLAPHRRGSLHPLRSFATGREPLAGAFCAVAGDPSARRLALALRMRPFTVRESDRALYHASAVLAANGLVALADAALAAGTRAGVPAEALLQLMEGALANAARLGPRDALTGPVVRGDAEVVARHLHALPSDLRALYAASMRHALRLAAGRGDPEGLRRIGRLLKAGSRRARRAG